MSHQSQKGSDFSIGLGWSRLSHCFQVLYAASYTFLGDVVSQVVDLVLKELTFGWLKLQIVPSEALKHNGQVM